MGLFRSFAFRGFPTSLPICRGSVWVRFLRRIGVLEGARAFFWVRFEKQLSVISCQFSVLRDRRCYSLAVYRTQMGLFRNFAFWMIHGSGRVVHGDARNGRRTQPPRAARRPYGYITPRVIGGRGGRERTGGLCLASGDPRVSPPHRFANEMGRQTPSLVPLRTRTCQINLLLR